jgi:putative transposase
MIRTTDSNHALPVASNLLNCDFAPGERLRAWMSNITFIPTRQGWVYLAGIKDLHSREIVGFSLSDHMHTGIMWEALTKAVRFHRPLVGLILHSDRGSRYCSGAYQAKPKAYGVSCSMGRKGNCYDNAPMKSFRGLLMNEMVHCKNYNSQTEAIPDLTAYIEVFFTIGKDVKRPLGIPPRLCSPETDYP